MSPDFKELLSTFNAHRVDYLVVGAHALAAHGAPLHDVDEEDLTRADTVFQIGVAPIRIDVLTSIDGVTFDEAWADRLTAKFVDLPVPVLSAKHLIKNKRTVGRTQDLADVEWLEKLRKKK